MHQKTLTLRVIGYMTSLLLTLVVYFIVIDPLFFEMSPNAAILLIFLLAIVQFMVQFFTFLDLWREWEAPWNLFIFLSTVAMIAVIVGFSIWIMNHLDYRMMFSAL